LKRETLLQYLRRYGCYRKREGKRHSLWCNPQTGVTEAVPRHNEIPGKLVQRIIKRLSLPPVEQK
jgi:mRNA interferase HicA